MASNCLETFVEGIQSIWRPLSTDVVMGCRQYLEQLLKAPVTEAWLAALHKEAPANRELYRDPTRGFVLLAHTEDPGLYRPPHDHGRGWGIYGVQQGEIAMATYARLERPEDDVQLVKRDEAPVSAGRTKVFLPGDIHDTRCITGPALLFRFTERDLSKEDKEEHRVTRYVEREGVWTIGTP